MDDCRELVSVIVPAYNVSSYIRQCLLSVLKQTYANLEVLVVDDGSEDETWAIVDEMACAYAQIHAIHQENRGVSAARNRAMDEAAGTYILFVDGDDYIAPDCVEYMVGLIQSTGSDFCFSRHCFSRTGEKQPKQQTAESLSADQAVVELLSPDVLVGCWNKLYRKSFLTENHIRFSEDLFYGEGLCFIISAAQAAARVGVGNRSVYHYRRNNPHSATTQFDVTKLYNGEASLERIGKLVNLEQAQVRNMYTLHLCTFYLGAITKLENNGVRKAYAADYARWLRGIRKHVPALLRSGMVRPYRAWMLIAGCICPRLIAKMDILRRKRIAQGSV